jgi:hypothetical protein
LAKETFEVSNGAIIPCAYRGSVEIADKTETTKNVQVDRTEHIDTVAKLCREGRFEFFNFTNQKDLIKDHLKDMVRDTTPEKPAVWRKLTGQDHYFHALAFMTTAIKYFTNDFTGYREEVVKTCLYFAGQDLMLPQGNLYGRQGKNQGLDTLLR